MNNLNPHKGLFIFKNTFPVGKIVKSVFVNSALKTQCHVVKKYTPTDCFSGDFAHWITLSRNNDLLQREMDLMDCETVCMIAHVNM